MVKITLKTRVKSKQNLDPLKRVKIFNRKYKRIFKNLQGNTKRQSISNVNKSVADIELNSGRKHSSSLQVVCF